MLGNGKDLGRTLDNRSIPCIVSFLHQEGGNGCDGGNTLDEEFVGHIAISKIESDIATLRLRYSDNEEMYDIYPIILTVPKHETRVAVGSTDTLSNVFRASIHSDSHTIVVQSKSEFGDETINIKLTIENFDLLRKFLPRHFITKGLTNILKEIPVNQFYNNTTTTTSASSTKHNDNDTSATTDSQQQGFFQTFRKQDLAFQHLCKLPLHLMVKCKIFSFESPQTGRRLFLLSDVDTFITKYFTIQPDSRHVYEIIPYSYPCRLYYDLEYCRIANPNINGNLLVKDWIVIVLWKLKELYDIDLSLHDVIVLDSTTNEKFSKHVIFHCYKYNDIPTNSRLNGGTNGNMDTNCNEHDKEYLFCDNTDTGKLTKHIVCDITEPIPYSTTTVIDEEDIPFISIDGYTRKPKPNFEKFWLYPKHDTDNNTPMGSTSSIKNKSKVFFVDMGVYTRNRAFRLYSSKKYGKKQSFRLDPLDRKTYYSQYDNTSLKNTMISVLVHSFIVPRDLLVVNDGITSSSQQLTTHDTFDRNEPKRQCIEHNSTSTSSSTNSSSNSDVSYSFDNYLTLFNSSKYQLLPRWDNMMKPTSNYYVRDGFMMNTTNIMMNTTKNDNNITLHHKSHSSNHADSWKLSSAIAQSKFTGQSSWFPILDNYVLQFVKYRSGGIDGTITSWIIYKQSNGDFPIYKIRYQIGKNRYCENIGRMHKSNGIYMDINLIAKEIYQGCWDNDCKGFKPKVVSIPSEVIPSPEEIVKIANVSVVVDDVS